MKLTKTNIITIVISVLILIVITLSIVLVTVQKKHKTFIASNVIVTQSFLDSLTYIANLSPIVMMHDTIIYDTIWIKETHYPNVEPDVVDSTLNTYNDSLFIKDTVDVAIKFKIKGTLIDGIDWTFKPIYNYKEIIVEKPEPYPVPYIVPVITYKTGLYISGTMGGNQNLFMFGADLDLVAKNDYIYGIEYRRFGKDNIFGVKYGINLGTIFK